MGHTFVRPKYVHEDFDAGSNYSVLYYPNGNQPSDSGSGVWKIVANPGQQVVAQSEATHNCPGAVTSWSDSNELPIDVSITNQTCPAQTDNDDDCVYRVYPIKPLTYKGNTEIILVWILTDTSGKNDPLTTAKIGDRIKVWPSKGTKITDDLQNTIKIDDPIQGILWSLGQTICPLSPPCNDNDSKLGTLEIYYGGNDNDASDTYDVPAVVNYGPIPVNVDPKIYFPTVTKITGNDSLDIKTYKPKTSTVPSVLSVVSSNDNDIEWVRYQQCETGDNPHHPYWVPVDDATDEYIQVELDDSTLSYEAVAQFGDILYPIPGIYYITPRTSSTEPTLSAQTIVDYTTRQGVSTNDCYDDPPPPPPPGPTPEPWVPVYSAHLTGIEGLGSRLPEACDLVYWRYSSTPDSEVTGYNDAVNHTDEYQGLVWQRNDSEYKLISHDPIADFYSYNDCAMWEDPQGCCPTVCKPCAENCRQHGNAAWWLVQNDRDCIQSCAEWNDHCACPEGTHKDGNDCICNNDNDSNNDCYELVCPKGYSLTAEGLCKIDFCPPCEECFSISGTSQNGEPNYDGEYSKTSGDGHDATWTRTEGEAATIEYGLNSAGNGVGYLLKDDNGVVRAESNHGGSLTVDQAEKLCPNSLLNWTQHDYYSAVTICPCTPTGPTPTPTVTPTPTPTVTPTPTPTVTPTPTPTVTPTPTPVSSNNDGNDA
jgi:hypothetical protein